MTHPTNRSILAAWSSIPRKLRRAVAGLSPRELRTRGGSDGRSVREYTHHLVEANLVAATIVLAALGKQGSRYDWSWLIPDEKWMQWLRYDRAPLEPAIRLLEALCVHISGIVENAPGGMRRQVRLVSSPRGRTARRSVRQILEEECEHARHHLRDIADARRASI